MPFRFKSPDITRDNYITTKPYQQFTDTASPSPIMIPFGESFQEPFVENDDYESSTIQTNDNPDTTLTDMKDYDEIPNTVQQSKETNPLQDLPRETTHVTRSGLQVRPPNRFDETQHSALSCVVSFQVQVSFQVW
eukprot:CAMPEP_0178909382 /NCGR_PEP_ID=MMETSP0786-20121207/8477_1 /TAXON_ID=186022 /ORGANISM="Thalassionema frauenfeldii, Strain CCMP 1798" /LENGTH=134 /DNA_ID=CAMNT_0020581449 /DNA_START=50 /DNA_END=451 /DNA_ORIENTATION=+